MMKRVKTKQYKSKREFKDDLDLIWSNCRMYNATEVSYPTFPFFHTRLTISTPTPDPSVEGVRKATGDQGPTTAGVYNRQERTR